MYISDLAEAARAVNTENGIDIVRDRKFSISDAMNVILSVHRLTKLLIYTGH